MTGFHRRSPIGFAHRGGRAHAPDNTLAAFGRALELGATGLESDVWLTKDGHAVLDHDGWVRRRWPASKQPLMHLLRGALPPYLATVDELYALCGDRVEVFFDIKDRAAAPVVVAAARAVSAQAVERLWLAHAGHNESDIREAVKWLELDGNFHLVDSTNASRIGTDIAGYAATIRRAGIGTINLPARHWTAQRIDACRNQGLTCFAFNAQRRAVLNRVLALGVDGVFSDHVDRMMAAINAAC